MTMLTSPSPKCAIEALQGERSRRPLRDDTTASGLRSVLEDGIYTLLGAEKTSTPLIIRSSSLRQSPQTTDISLSPQGRIRGVLVSQVLRLLSVGVKVERPFEEALLAWRLSDSGSDLLTSLERLDAEELARLATDVTAHSVTLIRSLGDVPPRWLPRTSLRATQSLAGGSVILRDVIDLMVGTTSSRVANVALFDVTTSPLGEGAERAMRYHALVQTLRTSTVPLRTSAFSTATGEMWSLDVDPELLFRSADEVLAAIANLKTPS